ncbi:MAG: polysaccharide deacetylase family protein [Bacillota bacterium]
MERRARAHFRVVRVNRWSLALLLILALALMFWPTRGFMPVSGAPSPHVREGVTVLGLDFSGKGEREARAMLQQIASAYQSAPVDAREFTDARGNAYVVPEVNGYELDVDMTWLRLSVAPPGSEVEPVTRTSPAARRLTDYPQGVIRQGNGEKQAITLLVNVDWGDRELMQMLPLLKKKGVKVTFFVSGRWADQHQNLLKLMAEDGHEIATHGHNLASGPKALAASGKLKGDIERSVAVIRTITGQEVKYYAPHMSEVSPQILKTAAELNLRTVLYSLDTVDWRDSTTTEKILGTFQQAKPGDLILLHPKPNTVRALDQAIDLVRSRGLKPVTLSEMLAPEPTRPSQPSLAVPSQP